MAQSVKNKIRGGTIFLFVLVLLSGGFSIFYLNKSKVDSENLVTANYASLVFTQAMQRSLDSIREGRTIFIDSFERHLVQEELNITEPGEKEAATELRKDFIRLKNNLKSVTDQDQLDRGLAEILAINMNAIKRKNEVAAAAAENAFSLLITIVSVIFLVGLTFVYNFPSIITEPLRKLTEAIREISQKNYTHRINIESKDEFGEMANAFNDMAGRLEYFESSNLNKLIFEKSRAEAVINSLKDASIGIDNTGLILFANNQALNLLGLQPKDVVGISGAEVSKRNDLFRFLLEDSSNMPFKVVVDNVENYFVKEVMDIVQEDSGNKLIVLKNITSFKELDEAKTNFIATISHELKTPLASSDLGIKLLEDERTGQLSADQKELLQQLKQDNQRMLRILSELLNMAQVDTGRIQLVVSDVNPQTIADSTITHFLNAAKEKNINIEKNYAATLPIIQADAEKTGWVLNNFISNALKYSSEGQAIQVSIRELASSVEFSVTDHGPGIVTEYLPRLFDRFYKVPGSMAKGTGLGLAISKEFIEAQHGEIWVKSEPGSGSTFGFTLPRATV